MRLCARTDPYRRLLWLVPLALCASLILPAQALATDLLAITAIDDQQPNIATVRTDGSSLQLLTNDDRSSSPAWSPDGSEIAFKRSQGDPRYVGYREIWVMDADGENAVRALTWNRDLAGSPAWSPDGRYIAFADQYDDWFEWQIVRLDLQTGLTKVLLVGESEGGVIDLDWSPDGKSIVFTVEYGDSASCRILDVASGATRPASEEYASFASWSKGSGRLAYSNQVEPWTSQGQEISIYEPGGVGPAALAQGSLYFGGLSWDPVGDWLAFDGAISKTDSGVYVMRSDGSGRRRILQDPRMTTYEYYYTDPAWQPSATSVYPVAGATRYDTAIEASKKAFPGGADTVVIATGENWPDALGGAALAGAYGGPILLTPASAIPDSVLREIDRLHAEGAFILGGTGAVSGAVESALAGKLGAGNVVRLGGADRYATAELIAREVADAPDSEFDGTCFVATGLNFPDALAGSPLAAGGDLPIFLAPTTGLTATTLGAIDDVGVSEALILGGTGVVSTAIESTLKSRLDGVERLWGPTRYETAAAVATYGVDSRGLGWDEVAFATGDNFPDALAGGVLQGADGSVMLLTPTASLHVSVRDVLAQNKADIEGVRFLGGSGAITPPVRTAILQVVQ